MIACRSISTAAVSLVVVAAACQPKEQAASSTDSVSQSASPATHDTSTMRRKILFVGTSLTAGYGLEPDSAYSYLIQRKIDSAGLPFEAVNAGVSGETTAGLLERLDWVLKANFDVIVIESGANDGLRGVAAAAMEKNLDEIVRRAKLAHPNSLILLVQMDAL